MDQLTDGWYTLGRFTSPAPFLPILMGNLPGVVPTAKRKQGLREVQQGEERPKIRSKHSIRRPGWLELITAKPFGAGGGPGDPASGPAGACSRPQRVSV